MSTTHEPDAAEIADIETRKAEMRGQKAAELARGGSVLSKRFVRPDKPGEPATTGGAARAAIKEFRRATGEQRDTRPHDSEALVRIAAEHPGASQPRLGRLYREATGRAITEVTIRKILRASGQVTKRAPAGAAPRARPVEEAAPRRELATVGRPEPAAAAPPASAPAVAAAPLRELDAIRAVAEVVDGLDPESRRRVLGWICFHYDGDD
jgi:hypothetical protein